MATLPVNIDATYTDSATDASVAAHQQHHDVLHQLNNDMPAELNKVRRGDVVLVWNATTAVYNLAPGQHDDGVSPRAFRGGADGAPAAWAGYGAARSGDWHLVG